VTGSERYIELYDEMENIVKNLAQSFAYGRQFEKELGTGRGIDEEILIGRAKAINDIADEMRFLKKFRGSLGLVR